MFEIGGYRIYPAFLAIVLVVVLLIVALVIFFIKKKGGGSEKPTKIKKIIEKREERRAVQAVSNWQKKYLPLIIDEEIAANDSEENQEYIELLEMVKKNILESKEWNVDSLLAINPNILHVLTDLFLDAALTDFNNGNKDNAVLLLHSIDCMHGTISILNTRKEWITDEVQKLEGGVNLSDEEKKAAYIAYSSLEKILMLINPDTNKIIQSSGVLNELKEFSGSRFVQSKETLTNVNSLFDITEYDREPIIYALFEESKEILDAMPLEKFREFEIFAFRVLASFIDNQPYSSVINTIE